ncbi:hypothetical protein [Roseomonas indoligenes]|uniref:Uncharacterized protein n=1 Tax=Roseomonas indoligenes TaxID=2820811 RepID=A0A940S695_9PROT|nr:hypothetical protein [Pararoseomonas indoligenes]MBP0491817.1 hypothetical protein [Pararoseomonas indoligenes]
MRGEMSTLKRDLPHDADRLDQVVQRLATTARMARLSVAGDLVEALQRALLAQRLSPLRED